MKISTPHARYDMRLNPVYQVDFKVGASGKRFAGTKRRVRFNFGFSNAEELAKGQTGSECRGDEHEVCLVWSLASGKRVVSADGIDVHFSVGKLTDTVFETSWTIRGGHMIKLIAYAAPPLFVSPGFRQFDLLLDGCSFFDMPRIFELGVKSNSTALVAVPGTGYSNYTVPSTKRERSLKQSPRKEPEHERHFAQRASIAGSPTSVLTRDYLAESPATTRDFLDSDNGPMAIEYSSTPSRVEKVVTPSPIYNATQQPSFQEPQYQTQQPQYQAQLSQYQVQQFPYHAQQSHHQTQQQQNHAQQQQSDQLYQHHQAQHNVQSPPRQQYYNEQHSMSQQPQPFLQLQYYESPAPVQQSTMATYNTPVPISPENASTPSSSTTANATTTMKLTMQPLSLKDMECQDEPALPELERAMKNLVNLDDITETMITPEQARLKDKRRSQEPNKSKPRPPVTPEWHLGLNPCIGDTQKYSQPRAVPTKEIMRTHVFDPAAAQAGMMVLYGSSVTASSSCGVVAGGPSPYYGHPQGQNYRAYY